MRAAMLLFGFVFLVSVGFGQQIAIDRIERMPNKPSPYLMRNWKEVAWGFDSLAFDFNRTGEHLPLGEINNATVNYSHLSFRLHTVVGTTDPSSAEAITCLPAVVGASLAGIDKSNQQATNWVLMCEEWFNTKNWTNLYLNHPDAATGDDWWYETMPNVFFFQLYSLYPSVGDFKTQFTAVADVWLGAVRGMGGKVTPWIVPNMDHRAWNFGTKSPNDEGVKEPEAAGAIAWLLYHAYVETGQKQYRVGAELAMEFLNGLSVNPSYEIQMPYGAYVAARMNAELGTEYDIAKMVNWCFDVGPLRSWGAIVGTWGGYDCSGFIGEVNGSNDYAFAMNTFEHVGALVPMVRYDDRFARPIGKWVLNAANAARLLYPNYLPDANQDSEAWARQYDSSSVIAHEAMRQFNGGTSPYATGDAISGGWGATNLALYASSHVGILGGIIDTTNVPGVLRLDVLKTDYFHESAYPTFLYFNPDSVTHAVTIDAGSEMYDLYDAVTNTFLASDVTGNTNFFLPSNSAALIVVTPAAGALSYNLDKTLVDGVVIDYRSGVSVANYPPRIKSLAPDSSLVLTNKSIQIYCTASDRDGDSLTYSWNASAGTILGSDAQITWLSPDTSCIAFISCEVTDGRGGRVIDTTLVQVVYSINYPPRIEKLQAVPRKIDLQSVSSISCVASDPDTDAVSFTWFSSAGNISGAGSTVTWLSPPAEGNYYVVCRVEDGRGGSTTDSIGLEVRDFSKFGSGQLVAFYPFNGNADDASGNQHHGVVSSTVPVTDRFGLAASAYAFDGVSSSVRIPNDTALNFQSAITINFWMKIGAYYTAREQYIISHGNWQNRWKISVTPLSNKLRWTVKTTSGIKDLDSETPVAVDSLYNVTALYNGADMEIYLTRALDAFTSWSGSILQTSIDLTVGQVLPSENSYNFNGVLDDIRIYDFALSPSQISALYDISTSIMDKSDEMRPTRYELAQNFPNPFNPSTTIVFSVPTSSNVKISVYDVLGRIVTTLLQGEMEPGRYSVTWNAGESASGVYFCVLQAGSVQMVMPMHLIR